MTLPLDQVLVIGTRGFRVLDGVRFPCEIRALETNDDDDDSTLTVRFTDDHAVETGVERDEFEVEPVTVDADAIRVPLPLPQIHDGALYDRLLLGRIASFLSHLQWITTLIRVNHTWHTTLLSNVSHWHNLRLQTSSRTFHRIRHLLGVQLLHANNNNNNNNNNPPTFTVVQAIRQLVLDGSAVTDDQVLMLVHKCPHVTHVSLRRCANVSFMLVYELQQLARERRCRPTTTAAATTATTTTTASDAADKTEFESAFVSGSDSESASLTILDLWLCPGISPSYVSQLTTGSSNPQSKKRPALTIHGPGFYCVDVPVEVYETLSGIATEIQGWSPVKLSVTWIEKKTLLATLHEQTDSAWSTLQRFVPLFKAFSTSTEVSVVPLVRLDPLLLLVPSRQGTRSHVTLGLPASLVGDLVRLVEEYEPESTREPLISLVLSMVEVMEPPTVDNNKTNETTKQEDPLEAQATRVFAMLRQTTHQLQAQVDHLEQQVAEMTTAKNKAEQEYKSAERELKRVAQEADRALLSLATSRDPDTDKNETQLSAGAASTPMIPAPPQNGIVTCRPEDTFLPALPSRERICELAQALESQCFAVLDEFVGTELSGQVRRDAERLYQTSRASEPQANVLLPPSPPPGKEQEEQLFDSSSGQFRLGELAGGNTGRNLRYQMAHVRGDYVL
jgi:hypothetical protein